jgi:RNA polymerase sigma-70 factor (ECF subfamily)
VVGARVAALFDEHASMVLGLCRLLLRDHHEAEDAAQQTFVSAYRSMLRGSEPRDAAPWLAAIARNECRARLRKRIRAPLALDGEVESQLTDPADLTEIADRRSEIAEVTAAMAELPIRQREAVALRDFLGLSYEEVASTLSVSVPVVESLLFRARRRLRDTVRTVPRYAAGLVAVPVAMRAAISRDIPDFDASTAGVVGSTGAALGAVVAKLVSLPFASKAATAVAIAAATTAVTPFVDHPAPPAAPPAAAPAALPAGPGAPLGTPALRPEPAVADVAPAAQAPAADQGSQTGGGASEPAPAGDAPAAEAPAAEPDRISVSTPDGPELELPATEPGTEPAPCGGSGETGCTEEADEGPAAEETDPATAPVLLPPQVLLQLLHDSPGWPVRDVPDRSQELPAFEPPARTRGDRSR